MICDPDAEVIMAGGGGKSRFCDPATEVINLGMASLLKDIYSLNFYKSFSKILARNIPSFSEKEFLRQIFTKEFENKELKERMRHTSVVLHNFFPEDYAATTQLLGKIIADLRKSGFGEDTLEFMLLPDYIEMYGLKDYKNSIKALELITQFVSCEYAVRPFLLQYEDKMLKQMTEWSLHKNHKVRRLSTEGARPRLPWAMAIPALKKDPQPVLAILENLKNDPSEWVRRSVANNLNDISRDHPGVVLEIARKWKGISKETDAIIKHGCRTLLKQGHAEILQYYGLSSAQVELSNFKILTPKVKIGGALEFSFSIRNTSAAEQKVRLEYAVYYMKSNGQLSKKVFKISERIYQPGEEAAVIRKQKFVLITTRTFYAGKHKMSVIINGQEKETGDFILV